MRTGARPPSTSTRTEQARRELGRTLVSRPVAVLLVSLTALAVLTPPVVQVAVDLAAGRGALPALGGPLELFLDFLASRGDAVEERLEEGSWLRHRLLPPTQALLTGTLGLGNERVVAGDDGWWYLADDLAHVTGRGFLDPAVIERRFVDEGVVADPVPKLTALAAGLERRGIALVVLPVPAKPTVVPAPLARGTPPAPIHNASFGRWLERLEAAGVTVHDPTAELLAVAADGVGPFLRGDTHWSPAAVDRVAARLASRLGALGIEGRSLGLFRRRVQLSGRGDLVNMLQLPAAAAAGAGEEVAADLVLTPEGDLWRPSPGAETLLLGDSFSNVFSDPGLSWGAGAGLAEQLAYHLDAGVERIAVNDGGAEAALAALRAAGAAGGDPLAGKKAVIYQFAARELSLGDWGPAPAAGADGL